MNRFYVQGHRHALEKLGIAPMLAAQKAQGPAQVQGQAGSGLWSKMKGMGNTVSQGVTGLAKHVTQPGFGTTQNRGLQL